MTHFRKFYDDKYIGSWDLNGEQVVTIESVRAEKLRKNDGGEERKLLVIFKGAKKGFVCNKTNGKTIANLYGPETDDWTGNRITLYVTKVQAFGQVHDAIRVRPDAPRANKKDTVDAPLAPEPVDPDPGSQLADIAAADGELL